MVDIGVLASVATALQRKASLAGVLQALSERGGQLLGARRVAVNLRDQSPLGGLPGWVATHARPLRATQPEPLSAFLGVPLLTGGNCIGVVSAHHQQERYFTIEHEEILTVLAAVAAPRVELARVERLTQIDSLTGVLNRHGLDVAFPEIAGAQLSLALVDIDHFKIVNDRHGHTAGDQVLRAVARALSKSVRSTDAVVRYGGDEFVLVLPGVSLEQAVGPLERIRASVARESIPLPTGPITVTVSCGVAEKRAGEERELLIARADAALYQAKRAGRNRVRCAGQIHLGFQRADKF